MRQIIKFCLVGGSSTVINLSIFYFLRTSFPLIPWWASQTVGFVFGVLNGFHWNRRWTFASQHQGPLRRQLPMFLATNTVGLVLNLLITKGFLWLFTGQVIHRVNPDPKINMLATICAIPIVVIWNFSISRFWTFRKPKGTPSTALSQSSVAPSE
jgi:putative flippase GtrA